MDVLHLSSMFFLQYSSFLWTKQTIPYDSTGTLHVGLDCWWHRSRQNSNGAPNGGGGGYKLQSATFD